MSKRILIVDDERNVRDMLRLYLEQDGYRVVEAANGREALQAARLEQPDLIMLDLMMPVMDGGEFMRIYRREAQTPVIMLTARVDEVDEVVGLELGADDYITKPFSVRVLRARVRSVLRRLAGPAPPSELLQAGNLTLDRAGRIAYIDDRVVDLTPSEFDLLATLLEQRGRALSRLDLLLALTGEAYAAQARTIDVHVRNLRAKIEPDPANPRYIQTVYGLGYRFAGE